MMKRETKEEEEEKEIMAMDDTIHSGEVLKKVGVLEKGRELLESVRETVLKVESIKEKIESYKAEFSSDDVATFPCLKEMIDEEAKLRLFLIAYHLGNGLTPTSERKQLEERISVFKEKVGVLEREKENLENTNSRLNRDIEGVTLAKSKLEEDIKDVNQIKSKLKVAISELSVNISGVKQANSELKVKIKQVETNLEEANSVKVNLEGANSGLHKELERQKHLMGLAEEKWEKEKDDIINLSTRVQNVLGEETELLLMHQTELTEMVTRRDNQIVGSPMQRMIEHLPETLKKIIAPKGTITGDEMGSFMGGFVNLTAYMVTSANKDVKATAMSGLATLLGLVIGTMFNNIVSYVSTVEKAKFKPTAIKAVTSLPWIILGAAIPILVGGFISPWSVRAIVTGVVTLLLMIGFATFWSLHYNIPKLHVFYVVCLGVIGIGLAAGAPDVLARIGKKKSEEP